MVVLALLWLLVGPVQNLAGPLERAYVKPECLSGLKVWNEHSGNLNCTYPAKGHLNRPWGKRLR